MAFQLEDLATTIAARTAESAEKSYTKTLLDKGVIHCGKKFGEEAVEFAIAAAQGDKCAMTAEAADVLYHLLVALQAGGIPLQDVLEELSRRTSKSGHEEKAARG